MYVADFPFDDFGEAVQVQADGVSLTQASSTALLAGEFFSDIDNDKLYVRNVADADPSTKFMTARFERFVGTIDAHTRRVPTSSDPSIREVYFEPLVRKAPSIKDTLKEVFSGFSADVRSSIELINATRWAEKIIWDSSFNLAPFDLYHWLGEKNDPATRKLILSGFCKDVAYSDDRLTIQVFDQRNVFSEEWRNVNTSFYSTTDFPNLDPFKIGRPIPTVYGVTHIGGTNVDYNDAAPSSSNNRDWVAASGTANLGTVTQTVSSSPTSTTTRTYVNSASGLRVGDSVLIDKATDESREITAVNYSGTPYIEHAALSVAATGGDTVSRDAVGIVEIVKDGVLYKALFGEHYTAATPGAGTFGITFTSALDSGGTPLLPSVLSPNDQLTFRVYGKRDSGILGAAQNDTGTDPTDNLTAPVIILYDILTNVAGLSASSIDTASFTALKATVTEGLGFSVPSTSTATRFPKIKDVLTNLFKSTLLRAFVSSTDAKWHLDQFGPFGAADFSVENDELKDGAFRYNFTYSKDVASRFVVQYAFRERSQNPNDRQSTFETEEFTSDVARYLHSIERTKEFDNVILFRSADALKLAERYAYIFGDRRGEVSFTVKNRFFEADLSNRIDITKVRLPSASFDNTAKVTQAFDINDKSQGLDEIVLSGDDLKGVTDNAGSW